MPRRMPLGEPLAQGGVPQGQDGSGQQGGPEEGEWQP